MSQDIFSTKLYDPNLGQIRQETEQLEDKYPFLLMPLRLETRYMQVDRPISGYEDADDIEALNLILELQYLFERMELFGILEPLEVKSIEGRIIEIIDILIQEVDDGLTLPWPENVWWEDNRNSILETYDSLVQKYNSLPQSTRELFNDIAVSLSTAIEKVQDLQVTKAASTEYEGAKLMIDNLNKVEQVFDQIIEKPNDYTTKTKHTYFNYLESRTSSVKNICDEVEGLALKNILANTNQINRIKEFSEVYASKLSKTQTVFSAIPSEFKRNEFLGKYENELQPGLENFSTVINEVITPKLEYIQKLKTVKASNLLYQAKRIQFELQNINIRGLSNYQQLKKTRTHLYGILRKFRANGHDIIVGPSWQVGQLKSTWSKVDGLLQDFTDLVGQVAVNGQYELAGRSRTISHINENYRTDLEGLRQGAQIDRAFIKNSNFIESANAFNIALRRMEDMADYMSLLAASQNLQKDELVEAGMKMQDFSSEFAVLAIKTTIIPEEYFKNIHAKFSNLQHSIEKIATKAGGNSDFIQPISNMNAMASAMDDSMKNFESDITDENDKFYDNFRKKFIYGDLTETVDELWVRIYPDDIFVNSHEKAVTLDERDDTHYFWTEVWNADNEKDVELAAWRALVAKYGENRAVYLRKAINPDSPQQTKEKPARTIIRLSRKLEPGINIINYILGQQLFVSSIVEYNLITTQNYLTDGLNMANTITSETFFLLNKAIDITRQLMERLNALNILVKKIIEDGTFVSTNLRMSLSNCIEMTSSIGEKLSGVKPVKDISVLPDIVIPDFPGIQTKDSPWSQAPRSDVMPDRFVFLGLKNNEFTHIKIGKAIPDPLIVGINPETAEAGSFEYDDLGNLLVDESTMWLTDFERAVEKGMGIVIPLTTTDKAAGFDKIIVLGVKNTGAEESKLLLEELLEAHTFSPDGAAFLPIGTPTNNTETKSSGFNSKDDADIVYDRITGDPLFDNTAENKENIDGYRLKEALGISPEILNRLENADKQDVYKSLLMNRSLWDGTMGYYMEEIMDTMFNLDNIKRTACFFNNYVTGRGWLPALRIGSQPYGILPTTAFSRFKVFPNENLPHLEGSDFVTLTESSLNEVLQKRFDIRLKRLFNYLRQKWMEIANSEQLKIDDFNPAEKTAQEHFMQLLGLQATSIEQYYRYNTNTAQRRSSNVDIGSTVNFSSEALYGPYNINALFGDFVSDGLFIDDTFYEMIVNDRGSKDMSEVEFKWQLALSRIKASRIFRLRYHDNFGQLMGPFVRENGDEFLKTIDGNTYIDQLLSTELNELWNPESFGEHYSNSLFFMFLRQSLALTYRDVGLDILMKEGLINENTRRRAGSKGTYLLPGPNRSDIVFTKWDYLFQTIGGLENMMQEKIFKRFPLAGDRRDSEFVQYLFSQGWTMAEYLFKATHDQQDGADPRDYDLDISKLFIHKNQLLELKDIPINELERLFAEHLDLCTYRFDAWQLGLANKRLNSMRKKTTGKEGIYLGAFGWLENLEPDDDKDVATNVPRQLRENDNKLVYTAKYTEGFIHAPSLNHALTAAILRSGYIANKQAGDLNNQMAVNLTSRRVRMALKLAQGIRGGQDVGALLGYQFERGLHENYLQQGLELDRFIYDLRRKFPLVPDVDSQADENVNEEQSTMNVVHGQNMLEFVHNYLGNALQSAESLYEVELQYEDQLKNQLDLPADIQANELRAILKEIDEMANAYDALGDLLMSESVYHIAQGNHVRSGAVFAALADGRVPPDIHIINTPRTGHVLTQRLILQLDAIDAQNLDSNPELAKPQFWHDIDLTPRAFTEPSLNKWLGEIIGDPSLIRCYVTYTRNETQEVCLVNLSDLEMQAVDAVYTLGIAAEKSSFNLNKLIAYHVRNEENLPVETELNIHYKDRDDHLVSDNETLSAEIKTFNEVLPLFSSLYETIAKARFTNAEDYVIPGEDIPADMNLQQFDIDNLKHRVDKALATFTQLRNNIKAIFGAKGVLYTDQAAVGNAAYSISEINDFRNYLAQCAQFALPNVTPDSVIETNGETAKVLAKQAADSIRVMELMTYDAEKCINYPDDLPDKLKTDKLVEAAKSIFGKSFVIVPQFILRNGQEIHQLGTLPHNDGILRFADEYAMDSWIDGIAKVRTKINKLEMISTMAAMFDTGFSDYVPIQLPYDTIENDEGETIGDYWLGLEYPSGYEPENDKLSLVILNKEYLTSTDTNARCCGLLIDEWFEIIPEREEITGITFNYDQPDAEPPQSMLLAVPPVETGNWKWDDLVYTILDTMDLYKARLVEPEHIDKSIFTQVLPAVLGEFPAPNQYREGIANLGMFDLAENNQGINE